MSSPFMLNDHLVDPSRNQILLSKQTTDVPPKAMAVLILLAKNAGHVVSHEELMEAVWPNAVVGPNTLQRSVTQLRKALGDNSKQQQFIKTHSKQGYSLIGEIKWQVEPITQAPSLIVKYWNSAYWLIVPIIILFSWLGNEEIKLIFSNPIPITATDRNETNAQYSPDGKFLVFKRNGPACNTHLWAKKLSSGEEYQLTKQAGIYGSVDWSADGNQLAFTSQNVCNKAPETVERCWQLDTIDFSLALQQPIESVARSSCQKNRVAVARWINEGDVALIVSDVNSNRQLRSFDLITGEYTVIYTPSNQKIYSYDYDPKQKQFAVISTTQDNQHRIEKVDLTGKVISTALILRGNSGSVYEYYGGYLHPSGDFIITYTDLGVFILDFEGRITKPDYDVLGKFIYPNFHPKENKLVVTHLVYDSDIALLKPSASQSESMNVIARSNVADENAQFQPNGNSIAFISNRTGSRQLWLFNKNKVTQISHEVLGLQSTEFVWSPTGNEIAVIVNDRIVVYTLDKKSRQIETSLPIRNILQWQTNNEILFIAKEDNQLFSIGGNNLLPTALDINNVQWAQKLTDDQLLYISHNKAYIEIAGETIHLPELTTILARPKFVLKEGKLFGINKKNQLWSYEVTNKKIDILHNVSKPRVSISDTRDDEFLLKFKVNGKKELLEFDIQY